MHSILKTVLASQRKSFLKRQNVDWNWNEPVPPHIERHLEMLIRRESLYQRHVKFSDNTDHMEATVVSEVCGNNIRRVLLREEREMPLTCWAYYLDNVSLPCRQEHLWLVRNLAQWVCSSFPGRTAWQLHGKNSTRAYSFQYLFKQTSIEWY